MSCIHIANGIVCVNPTYILTVAWRDYRFEWSDWTGPAFVAKNGGLLAKQPGEHHEVWPALKAWLDGGKRVDETGRCVT